MRILLAAAICLVATPALAQSTGSAAPATARANPHPLVPLVNISAPDNILRTGTPVHFRMMEPLTSEGRTLRVGYRFNMEVSEPVMANGAVVIPAGTPAIGEVTEVRRKGMWGRSGHITCHIASVMLNGRQIRMSGTFDDKGVTGTAGVVAAVAFVPVVGFFVTGTSARIAQGGIVGGFLDEDLPFTAPAGGATPVAVQATAVPAPVPAVAVSPIPVSSHH